MLCRIEVVNQDEHHKTRISIAKQRYVELKEMYDEAMKEAQEIEERGETVPVEIRNMKKPTVDIITAQLEMLNVSDAEEQKIRHSINRKIFEDLLYPGLTDRDGDIVKAYPETFEWVFRDTVEWELPWSDFGKWLREGEGIYWINGKAGSGKSTLMKHIHDDARVKMFLEQWSRGALRGKPQCCAQAPCRHYPCDQQRPCGRLPSCVAIFYFWNSGTNMQKSQQGLLRSLLLQVLEEHPDLIAIVFPSMWTRLYQKTLNNYPLQRAHAWSLPELKAAFERLIKQKYYALRLCFFVDGLDEFGGDEVDLEELCTFFRDLSRASEDSKFCLSSRPWNLFQEVLGEFPKLRLQDLTSKDIETYVTGKFNQSPSFLKLATNDEMLVSSLSLEIKEKADGVFLWVQIVVRFLLRGINNKDTVSQLWKRLRSFPKELNSLYDSIL